MIFLHSTSASLDQHVNTESFRKSFAPGRMPYEATIRTQVLPRLASPRFGCARTMLPAISYGYGEESPYAKLVAIAAKVLMLGAPLDTITLFHHAEHIARLTPKPVRRFRRKLLIAGEPVNRAGWMLKSSSLPIPSSTACRPTISHKLLPPH
jgi:hypothetical protein